MERLGKLSDYARGVEGRSLAPPSGGQAFDEAFELFVEFVGAVFRSVKAPDICKKVCR